MTQIVSKNSTECWIFTLISHITNSPTAISLKEALQKNEKKAKSKEGDEAENE